MGTFDTTPLSSAGNLTVREAIHAAQRILADEVGSQARWEEADLLEYVQDAQRDILRERPHLRLESGGAYAAIPELAAMADEMAFDGRYRAAVANYIASRALEEDGIDEQNAKRAERLFQKFRQEIT